MKITRRKLGAAVVGSAAAALAQTPAGLPSAEDDLKAARDRMRANAETLAKQDLPMAIEPAVQFRA